MPPTSTTTALQKAAAGIFPEGIIEDVSPQRVARFFKKQGRSYHVVRQLREMMIFAPHNLTRDPPFTRMHLVTCRNLLIYMQPQLQQQVLSTLHFALQPKGVLFLGAAETVGDLQEEFNTLHQKWKIFEKKREVRLPLSMAGGLLPRAVQGPPLAGEAADAGLGLRLESMTAEAFGATLRQQQAICVLVSARNELLQVIGDPALFLRVPEGKVAAGRDQDGAQAAGPAVEHGLAPSADAERAGLTQRREGRAALRRSARDAPRRWQSVA